MDYMIFNMVYMCVLAEFAAKSTKEIAHHILLFACSDAGPDDTWLVDRYIDILESLYN